MSKFTMYTDHRLFTDKHSKFRLILWLILLGLFLFPNHLKSEDNFDEFAFDGVSADIYIEDWFGKESFDQPGYTLIFIELNPNELTFTKSQNAYIARNEVEVAIFNAKDEQVAIEIIADSLEAQTYQEASNYKWNRLYRLSFELEDGEYHALVRITDKNAQGDKTLHRKFEVQNSTASPIEVSDILFAKKDQVNESGNQSKRTVLPYPARVYGVEQPGLYCYFEIYHQKVNDGDQIHYTISLIDPENQQKILEDKWIDSMKPKIPVMYSFDTERLKPGEYQMLVQIRSKNSPFELERSNRFTVYQSPTDLRFKTYDKLLKELKLIASEAEWKQLQDVPAKERQHLVDKFWEKRDPTPETVKNELMTEFYSRVFLAETYFWQGNDEKGWFTDQGKVYIMMGNPDNKTRHVDPNTRSSVEVWHYVEPSLKVVFRDDYGFGNYQLISPFSLISELQ